MHEQAAIVVKQASRWTAGNASDSAKQQRDAASTVVPPTAAGPPRSNGLGLKDAIRGLV